MAKKTLMLGNTQHTKRSHQHRHTRYRLHVDVSALVDARLWNLPSFTRMASVTKLSHPLSDGRIAGRLVAVDHVLHGVRGKNNDNTHSPQSAVNVHPTKANK
jgi:hypothetical protein